MILFPQGLYGRSWTKIASMIETRTALQVKNYAKQYFRQKVMLQTVFLNLSLVSTEAKLLLNKTK